MNEPSRVGRFGGLVRAAKARGELPATEAQPETASPAPESPPAATKERPAGKGRPDAPSPDNGAQSAAPAEVVKRGPGRPNGKRSDTATFRQVSALVRRDTYKATQRRLLEEEREFSQLVESLLARWVRGEIDG